MGDEEAFGSICSQVVDRLFSIAVRILHNHQDAEDAVQSALVDAWRDLPSLRETARFDAWLYRLLVRACYDQAGKRRQEAQGVTLLVLEPSTGDDTSAVVDRDQLARAFRRLPIDPRSVAVLHHFFSIPLTDVADALGIPEGTARPRLHYALKTLRAAIDADDRQAVVGGQVA